MVGTPEKIRERLKQYAEVGVDQFLLAFQDPLDAKALELFIDAVGREVRKSKAKYRNVRFADF